jgi:hypothetical protein
MNINRKLSLLVVLLLSHVGSFADRTNVNEVTDLFDRSIPNKDGFVSNIEGARARNISDIESGASLGHIQDMDKTSAEISKLNAIRAVDLDDAGRGARQSEEYKFYDQGEFETNFNKPGYAMHKQDVQQIVGATSALLSNITAGLKNLGVDCKEVKGSMQKTPIHVIDTKREEQKNTEYDQIICQQPKNQYRCSDLLSLTCIKRRENKDLHHVVIPISEIPSQFINRRLVGGVLIVPIRDGLLFIDSGKDQVFKDLVSKRISNKKISIPNQFIIFSDMTTYAKNADAGAYLVISEQHPRDGTVKVYYQVAGECEIWSEDWNQRCVLQ